VLKIHVNVSGITRALDVLRRDVNDLPKEAHKVFVANTPIKTGNARRSTKLEANRIRADYPYAHRLDEGWSKQRPNGMTEPTLRWLDRRLKDIARKT